MWGDFWNGEDLSVWSNADIHHSAIADPNQPISVETTFVDSTEVTEALSERATTSSSENSVNSTTALMKTKSYPQPNIDTSTLAFSFPYNESLNAGSRAFEAFVRPSPIVVAGTPKSYSFDIRSCTFTMSMEPFQEDPPEDAPTELFLPEYLFKDCEPEISVSSGRWIVYRPGQILRWWHSGLGKQSLRVLSAYKKEGVVGTADSDIDGWYYWNGKCQVM